MRLTEYQRKSIIENVKIVFGDNSKVYLFGSRVDDSKRGGDIDLFIECDVCYNDFDNKLKLLSKLYASIGEQKIDIIIKTINKDDDRLVVKEALKKGILLNSLEHI